MGKIVKFALGGFGAIAALIILAIGGVWAVSAAKLNQKFDTPDVAFAHSTDAAIIAEGERVAAITGCTGCHGDRMQGHVLAELPDGSRIATTNIPRLAASYSDHDLARVIKYGVRPDKRSVMIMPSEAFFALTDEDLTAILSFIRSTPDDGGDTLSSKYGPMIRAFIAKGELKTAAHHIGDMSAPPAYDFTSQIDRGAYLARVACAECHGLDFKGQRWPDGTEIPDLVVASAYSVDEFNHLMDTGAGRGGRDLGIMGEVAEARFHAFSGDEISDLHAFLLDRALNGQ